MAFGYKRVPSESTVVPAKGRNRAVGQTAKQESWPFSLFLRRRPNIYPVSTTQRKSGQGCWMALKVKITFTSVAHRKVLESLRALSSTAIVRVLCRPQERWPWNLGAVRRGQITLKNTRPKRDILQQAPSAKRISECHPNPTPTPLLYPHTSSTT